MDVAKAVEVIKGHEEAEIYTHIDADGISAGAIMSSTLDRMGIRHKVRFVKQLEPGIISGIEPNEFTIFTDLGSGQLGLLKDKFDGKNVLIIDHHQPSAVRWKGLVHINPYLQNFNGSSEISAAGVAYFVARELDKNNFDLAPLSIVGAVGDMQNFWGKLEGLNRKILVDAVNHGLVKSRIDLQLYGRQTRPVFKSLQYFTDPYVPDVSNSESGAISLLTSLGIKMKENNKWRTLSDLTHEEKQKLGTEIVKKAIAHAPVELKRYVQSLIVGEVYELLKEEEGTELRDASEFSTAMNACGRNDMPGVGLEIAKGSRGEYSSLLELIRIHRRNLAAGIEYVGETGIIQKKTFQYFDARGKIKETLVGTVAGMVLGSEQTDPYKPILGFAVGPDDTIKISARCSRLLVLKGINLGKVLKNVCEKVGGIGGGHFPAAGGYIPEEKVDKFLMLFGSSI